MNALELTVALSRNVVPWPVTPYVLSTIEARPSALVQVVRGQRPGCHCGHTRCCRPRQEP